MSCPQWWGVTLANQSQAESMTVTVYPRREEHIREAQELTPSYWTNSNENHRLDLFNISIRQQWDEEQMESTSKVHRNLKCVSSRVSDSSKTKMNQLFWSVLWEISKTKWILTVDKTYSRVWLLNMISFVLRVILLL